MYDTNSRGNRPTIRLMLVDTHEERLVEHIVSERSETPYIALSYVWGQTPMLQTSMSNLADLKAPGALSTQAVHLPRTVRDAMALVKGIGYKFLWVDALCIVQDGPNKCKEIEEMNLIYMRARLTIVAMAGGDANSGLPGVMPGTRTQPAVVIDGYKLLAKLPSFEVELKRSRHFTRGWTYQEMLLASRCLFVSPYQVHFRCTKGTASEGRGPEIKSSIFHTVSTLIWPIQDVDSTRFINAYEDYVKAYTRRFLTYDNDILNAFTGVLKELSLLFASSFHEAIPGADIVRALLWCPTASPKRRSSTTKPPTDSTPYFPSWSWIGWKGPITYAVSRIGKATDRTDMQGLLLEASLQWKRAGATGFEKIKTTNTAQGEPKGTSCGFDDCHISLKTDDKDRHTAPQEVLTVWPNAESQGRAQDSPAELTNLSILRFRASTVMAGSYYFGECEFRQVESYDSVETMQFLPIYDVHKRQCGGLYNPAVNGLTLNESQQFSIIAMSAFRTTNYSAHGLIDDHYGFMYNGGPDRSKCRCLLHIILIKSHGEIAERVATGLMHPKAWSNAQPRPEYTLINLA
ncbi:heterokaryon incompatibility protein-domain-containing protein [Aspergillus avenaceus]|uniref:Heterokaryon incompatibility protein-domain-containing protein n=1 Tax=Aspergillus avenaceus TaxID=36643 RepID=A0A5N6U1A5_ASPAV|nr:heterokaryon incompatibility protein-domain-containing protein [Aspergillus avenaceus]